MTPLDTPPGAAPVAHPDPVDSALWSVDRVAELFELPFSDPGNDHVVMEIQFPVTRVA